MRFVIFLVVIASNRLRIVSENKHSALNALIAIIISGNKYSAKCLMIAAL